jgi:predicted XRE-type DNA-binding protein
MSKRTIHGFDHIEDAIAASADEALDLKLRNQIMDTILDWIREKQWTEEDIARYCRVTKSEASRLVRNKVSRFSSNDLIKIAAHADIPIVYHRIVDVD